MSHQKTQSISACISVLGAASLWAWGFLAYLSPALFDASFVQTQSVGIEFGFFASQGVCVLMALGIVRYARQHHIVVSSYWLGLCGLVTSLTTYALSYFVSQQNLVGILACGVLCGIFPIFLGCAWGARFSAGNEHSYSLAVLSYLICYFLYLSSTVIPLSFVKYLTIALPVLSWVCWYIDAKLRNVTAHDVLPGNKHKKTDFPGEVSAGIHTRALFPYQHIALLVGISVLGNIISAIIMNTSYTHAGSIFYGGCFVSAILATLTLVVFSSSQNRPLITPVFILTIFFFVLGVLLLIAFNDRMSYFAGLLVQGSALILQILLFTLVLYYTKTFGFAPLVSFCICQGITSAAVGTGNVIGRFVLIEVPLTYETFQFLLIGIVLGLFGLLLKKPELFSATSLLPSAPSEKSEHGTLMGNISSEYGIDALAMEEHTGPAHANAGETPRDKTGDLETRTDNSDSGDVWGISQTLEQFSKAYGLTPREREVLELLAQGRSHPYIANKLYVTTGTIKTHVQHIYQKVNVRNRQELLDTFARF